MIRDERTGELGSHSLAGRPSTNRSPQAVPSGWSFRYASRSAVVGKPSSVSPVAERQALAFPRPVGERAQHVGGELALAVLLEEIDDLGVAQPALLRLVHAGLRESERLDGPEWAEPLSAIRPRSPAVRASAWSR